jgi:predicted nucleic acid-binding protein
MSEAHLSVFVDANIIWSKSLLDWVNLCSLQKNPPYHVRWSEDVLAEVHYAWRRQNPGAPERSIGVPLERFQVLHPVGQVTGYNPEDYPRPATDEHDWHVVAAAAHARCDVLLTNDARAFTPDCIQGRFRVETADEFFLMILRRRPEIISAVFTYQYDFYRNLYGRSPEFLLGRLEKAGATQFAKEIPRALPQLFK